MFALLNFTTRILDCDLQFAKTFKYNQNEDTPKYHYFIDCMDKEDYDKLKQLNVGEKLEKVMRLGNPKRVKSAEYNVSIECVDSGEYDWKTNKNKLNYVVIADTL